MNGDSQQVVNLLIDRMNTMENNLTHTIQENKSDLYGDIMRVEGRLDAYINVARAEHDALHDRIGKITETMGIFQAATARASMSLYERALHLVGYLAVGLGVYLFKA